MEVFNELVTPRLGSLERTVRSLYSNGSGGPPGYLETARAEDQERFKKLFQFVEATQENASTFKEFIKSYYAEKAHTKLRVKQGIKVGRWILGVVGSALLALGGLAYHAAVPVVKVLWDDYVKAHPQVQEDLKKVTVVPPNGTAANADLPDSYQK